MKKLALFDIDGVIYEGHSIFDSIQNWEKGGFIKKGLWKIVLSLFDRYKSGELNYKQVVDEMLLQYSKYLNGKKYEDVLNYNLDSIERNKSKIFPYFTDLVGKLQITHDLYFVTANFDFTAEAFAKTFGLNGFLSSKIKKENDVVKEGIELSLGGNKGIVINLINKYGDGGSIAVGDSENDADMLDLVEFPFVMEPNEKLAEIAKTKNWQVVNRDTIADIILKHAK